MFDTIYNVGNYIIDEVMLGANLYITGWKNIMLHPIETTTTIVRSFLNPRQTIKNLINQSYHHPIAMGANFTLSWLTGRIVSATINIGSDALNQYTNRTQISSSIPPTHAVPCPHHLAQELNQQIISTVETSYTPLLSENINYLSNIGQYVLVNSSPCCLSTYAASTTAQTVSFTASTVEKQIEPNSPAHDKSSKEGGCCQSPASFFHHPASSKNQQSEKLEEQRPSIKYKHA